MPCTLDDTLHCTVCGRLGKAGRKQMCQVPCAPPQQPKTCPECSTPLVRKQRLPEGKWYWRCELCRVDKGECVGCNKRIA